MIDDFNRIIAQLSFPLSTWFMLLEYIRACELSITLFGIWHYSLEVDVLSTST